MGAIASGGARVLNDDVVSWYGVPEAVIDEIAGRDFSQTTDDEVRELLHAAFRTSAGER